MFIQLAAVIFIYHYPNVRDGHFDRSLGTRSQATLEILGENAIFWSVVEYFSGSVPAGL